jgi:predicted glutamine amidotransferase
MCIIAIKPADSKIAISKIFNMWVNNPHGAGIMFAQDGELKVVKGLMDLGAFLDAYNEHKDKKLVIHFRWRTHGPVLGKLTHPFWINGDVAMVHNGIIPGIKTPKGESDTSMYIRTLQRRYSDPMKALRKEGTRKFILREIGLSKLVFMNANGTIQMLNGQTGHFSDEDGCWYSNHSYTDSANYDKLYGDLDYNPKFWQHSTDLITL